MAFFAHLGAAQRVCQKIGNRRSESDVTADEQASLVVGDYVAYAAGAAMQLRVWRTP